MEKGKSGSRRGAQSKLRALPPSGDFIALGSKQGSGSSRQGSDSPLDPKLGLSSSKSTSSSSSLDRKKDTSSSSLSLGSKKIKLTPSVSSISVSGRNINERKETSSNVAEPWESVAESVESIEIVNTVLRTDDEDKIEAILCGAIKSLKTSKSKPDSILYFGLMYLAKLKPSYFTSEFVIEGLCSLLRRSTSFKGTKGSNLVSVLAANILLITLHEEQQWPDILVKAFIDDSVGERNWVDHAECKGLIDNILTAFGTVSPSQSQLTSDLNFKPDCPSPTPSIGIDDDESSDSTLFLECKEIMNNVTVQPRFSHSKLKVEKLALDVAREQLARRQQPMDIPRNVLRFLASTCGLSEVRLMCAQRLELWLQNTKLSRPAQDLQMSICLNCRMLNQHDVEVISCLTKIRLKGKPLVNQYLQCIRELLDVHSENLSTVLKHTIYNELSNSRNPNNMAVLSVIFQHSPEEAAKMLAEVFQDLLTNRDDYLRALRALLREIVRNLRYDMQFSAFCLGLMTERKDQFFKDLDSQIKERMFLSLGDLITMTIFLAISPAVKDAATSFVRGDRKDLSVLKAYQNEVAIIQRNAIWWFHTIVMNTFKVGKNEFIHCLHKILFMEQAEHYFNKDNWPSESERPLMIRLASEMPVLEDTLIRVLIVGLSKEHHLKSQEALELADQLVRRAAALHMEGDPVLKIERLQLVELLFNLCIYHHPDSIVLPKGYQPPSLAISKLYWKVWIILLIAVAHNPGTFGHAVWQTYATIRTLIEMCITGHFTFPPPTLASGEKADEIKSKELQLAQLEKQEILQFESHLAAASTNITITEETSLLLAQLTTLDPQGVARHPPAQVLEQLKQLNSSMKLGHLLCRSRNPDFLLDIIQRQGTSESMPWLAELVASSAGSFDMLPIQCLCEFLLHEPYIGGQNENEDKEDARADKTERAKLKLKQKKQKQLLHYMRTLLFDSSSDPIASCEILDYFLRRLSSKQSSARILAAQGLQMVLGHSNDEESNESSEKNENNKLYSWVNQMTLLPHFKVIKRQICINLRLACSVENNPIAVSDYIKFLASYHPADTPQDLSDLAYDVAPVLVNRTTLINSLIPTASNQNEDYSVQNAFLRIFTNYLPRAMKLTKEAYSWSISQDKILVQWPSGYAATMHIQIAHAMVVLLTYGPPADNPKFYDTLLEHWFPSEGEPPQAYLVDTSELALLFPDWLKLRMISSKVDKLVDTALKDLDPGQLVLFVQSFGIPVPTVSKLLHSLDAVAHIDCKSLQQAVVDKSYMCQLVDVQQQRGAVGGNKFVEILSDPKEKNLEEEIIMEVDHQQEIKPKTKSTTCNIETNISDYLIKLFCSNDCKIQREIFYSLIKKFGNKATKKQNDRMFFVNIQKSITQMLLSSTAKAFITGLHTYSCYSCPMFSLLYRFQAEDDLLSLYLPLIELINNQSFSSKSPLESMLSKHSKKLKENKIIANDAEEIKHKIISGQWNINDTKELLSNMINLLQKEDNMKSVKNSDRLGMYVDTVRLIEPEILQTHPELEKQLLFYSSKSDGQIKKASCRQYFLALLIHHTNWSTIHRTINLCLDFKSSSRMDPSAVLDFLWSCIDIPRLWQGQDKNKSKHSPVYNVMKLNEIQVCSLMNFILQEAFPFKDNAAKVLEVLSSRLPLLLHCLNNQPSCVEVAVDHAVTSINSATDWKARIMRQLFVCLYAQIPHLIIKAKDRSFDLLMSDSTIIEASSSSLDTVSHNLLTALVSVKHGKQGAQRLQDLEVECRKLAATHPLLLLRQLPMISSSLNGRLNFGFNVFTSRNYLGYFNSIMGLLELMKPFIFHEIYHNSLVQILNIYLEFIQVHGIKNKHGIPLTQKIIKFFLDFMNFSSAEACHIIEENSSIFESLNDKYPDLPYLKSLLTSKDVLIKESSSSSDSFKNSSNTLNIIESTALVKFNFNLSVPVNKNQISTIVSQLSSKSTDDILSALYDLSNISKLNPYLLSYTFNALKALMSINHIRCREVSYDLIMKHLKNQAKSSSDFLSVYISCLNSENSDILITALEHLAEIIIIDQENGAELLNEVFNLGITKGIDIKPYISETIFLLSMQDGL